MRKLIPILVLLTACSTSIRSTAETRARVKSTPNWYLNRQTSNAYVYGYSSVESKDMNFAIEMAQSIARSDIGRQLEIKYGELQKRFQEQTQLTDDSELLQQFTSAYRQVMSETLVGVRSKEMVVLPGNGVYVVYSMMEMPIGDSNSRFIQNLRNRQVLYTRLRATEIYQELDSATRRLDSLRTP